jgi:hypothetical protein
MKQPFLSEATNELWAKRIQRGIEEYGAKQIAERDFEFRDKIAPEIAKSVVEQLRFWFVTTDGNEVEVPPVRVVQRRPYLQRSFNG